MRRFLLLMLVGSLCIASLGLADVNRDIWSDGGLADLDAVRSWFADKRPDRVADPAPDIQDILTESKSPDLGVDNYNMQMWAWVTIPEDGEYQWWVHSDDQSVLYVSTDDSWANVEEVAVVSGWMSGNDWRQSDGGGNNMSAFTPYAAGQKLAVWAVMTERGGGDNLGIGWIMPGQTDITYVTPYIAIDTTQAKPISPAAGATDVLRDEAVLEWLAGEFANTHNVYLSTDPDAVVGGAAEALVAEGLPLEQTAYDPGRLDFDRTYYWRVDEVGAEPNLAVSPSKIVSFTIEAKALALDSIAGATASSADVDSGPEKTIDGSGLTGGAHGTDLATMWLTDMEDVDGRWIQYDLGGMYSLHQMKVWNHNSQTEAFLGYGIKEAKIEVSSDGETWTEVGIVEIPQASGSPDYTGSDVDLSGAMGQYVKITAVSNYSILGLTQAGLSEVQFSYIPTKARELSPADGTTIDGIDATLSWRAGRLAALHEVMFDADKQAVIDNNAVVAATEELSYDLMDLDLASAYFWKINEVNEAETPAVHEGDVMTFITPEARVLDDMEMYAVEDGLYIWQWWADGLGHDDNGSVVGNGDAPEYEEVYEGAQSMPMTYDNAAPVSEATATFDPALNLTAGNPESLDLYFKGIPYEFNGYYSADGVDWTLMSWSPRYVVMSDDALIGMAVTSHDTAQVTTAVYSDVSTTGDVTGDWTQADIGGTHPEGEFTDVNGVITIQASGADIWTSADEFRYVYKSFTGDASITAKVESLEHVHNWAKGGVMIRDKAIPESSFAMTAVTPVGTQGVRYQARIEEAINATSDSGSLDGTQQVTDPPAWIRMERKAQNAAGMIYVTVTDTAGKSVKVAHADASGTQLGDWTLLSVPMADLDGLDTSSIASIAVGVEGDGGEGKIFVDYIHTIRARAVPVTYSFDDLPADSGACDGIHAGIDFGTGDWWGGDSWYGMTQCGYFSDHFVDVPMSFTLPENAHLVSIAISGEAAYAYTISDGVNADIVGTTGTEPEVLTTGWTSGGSTITITTEGGWEVVFDDITYITPN